MVAPTAPALAICTITLLVVDVLTWGLRFYVRLSRKAWGPDDWSMVVAIPPFAVTSVAMLAIAFTGGGLKDDQISELQRETAMFWWFIMQTMWCLAAIPIKWAVCFTLLRIANKQKVYVISIYCCMAAVLVVMLSTTIYEFAHCDPVPMNWKPTKIEGHCKPQSNITRFSYALSAVSILTDWFCAIVPIPLLWKVQMDNRIKLSVLGLLGLGVFASVGPLVRLSVTINLNATKDFLYHAMDVAVWAQTELAMGVIVANLPALRPLLEKILSMRSTIRSDEKRDKQSKTTDRYLELGEGCSSRFTRSKSGSQKGNETRIYGGATVADSNESLSDRDDHSQKNIVATPDPFPATGIIVDREVHIEVNNQNT